MTIFHAFFRQFNALPIVVLLETFHSDWNDLELNPNEARSLSFCWFMKRAPKVFAPIANEPKTSKTTKEIPHWGKWVLSGFHSMTQLMLLTTACTEEIDVRQLSRKLALLLPHHNPLHGCADVTRLPLGFLVALLHNNSVSCETPFRHPTSLLHRSNVSCREMTDEIFVLL